MSLQTIVLSSVVMFSAFAGVTFLGGYLSYYLKKSKRN